MSAALDQNLEAHNVYNLVQSVNVQADEPLDVPDLYVCLDECYVYSTTGNDEGIPRDDASIVYDTVPDEILQLDVENRRGKYVQCIKPVEGWVFLPEFDIQYDWAKLDEIYFHKKSAHDKPKQNDNENNEDGYTIDTSNEQQEYKTDKKNNNNQSDDSHLIIQDERRNYEVQRMMMQTIAPELDKEPNKIMQIGCIARLVFFLRRHPFLPKIFDDEGLIFKAFTASLALFDIYSDLRLALELYMNGNAIYFMLSMSFICAPFFVAWCVASQMVGKQLNQKRNNICFIIGVSIYNLFPFGTLFMLFVDIYRFIESVFIRPIFFCCSCRETRTISYEERGYWLFRDVVELFCEAIPQVILLTILIFRGSCDQCTTQTLITAYCSSLFQLCKLTFILYKKANSNGVTFTQYVTIVLRASIDFIPSLPAIRNGQPKVNWTTYKFSSSNVGHLAMGLNALNCRLNVAKISSYTIKDLNRFACKYVGAALSSMQNSDSHMHLIVTRLEEEVSALF
eukprot:153939_1